MRVRVEEERYAIVQCSCFILSCAGLVLYFFTKCGLLAGLLAVDEFLEIQLEAVLLLAHRRPSVTSPNEHHRRSYSEEVRLATGPK